jgi:hemolysin activation/secretion protein
VATVGALGVIGDGTILGGRWLRPLSAWGGSVLSLGVDHKDFKEDVALGDGGTVSTPIDYSSASADLFSTRRGEGRQTRLGIGATLGLRLLGNQDREFEAKRAGAGANFAYLRGEAEHLRALAQGRQLLGRLRGQLASGPLVSNEQIAAGGADSVRGYPEAVVLGDDGLLVTLELRSAPLSAAAGLGEVRLHGFLDGARLRIQEPLPGQADSATLAGVGLGVRATRADGLAADLAWSWALQDAGGVEAGDSRAHVRLGYEF